MEDKIQLIVDTLRDKVSVEFSRLLRGLEGVESRMHGVMTLLASLELGRRRRVQLRQVEPFSELWLYRREEDGLDDARPEGDGGVADGPDMPSGAERHE
jgi:chromatin segregation and condensation protein Rec8/ScpA/Scc1 (kleisin family)